MMGSVLILSLGAGTHSTRNAFQSVHVGDTQFRLDANRLTLNDNDIMLRKGMSLNVERCEGAS